MKNFGFAIALLGAMVAGCSTSGGYGRGSNLQHTYVTNTQQNHALTGAVLSYNPDGGKQFLNSIGQVLTATKLKLNFYLNHELVDSTNVVSAYENFLRIPPGVHEFAVEVHGVGLYTMGVPSTIYLGVWEFEVSRSRRAVINVREGGGKGPMSVEFEDVTNSRFIDDCTTYLVEGNSSGIKNKGVLGRCSVYQK